MKGDSFLAMRHLWDRRLRGFGIIPEPERNWAEVVETLDRPLRRRRNVDRAEKEAFITQMKETVSGSNVIIVAHYSGLNVVKMNELRNRMREAGAQLRVTKNRLTKLALEGTQYAGIADMFVGPTAIAFSDDVVAPAKVVVEFAKTNENLVVIGGAMGEDRLDEAGVKALAALPSLDELRATMAALVNTPATRIVGVLAAPAGQLARVMGAYGETG